MICVMGYYLLHNSFSCAFLSFGDRFVIPVKNRDETSEAFDELRDSLLPVSSR
jgi:hypothetical protein